MFNCMEFFFFFFPHILSSFGLDLNIMTQVSALWNIIVTGCNTLNIWFRLYVGIRCIFVTDFSQLYIRAKIKDLTFHDFDLPDFTSLSIFLCFFHAWPTSRSTFSIGYVLLIFFEHFQWACCFLNEELLVTVAVQSHSEVIPFKDCTKPIDSSSAMRMFSA